MRQWITSICLLGALAGCKEELPQRPVDELPAVFTQGVFVTNEGTFQWGNASVTYYDLQKQSSSTQDLFQSKNNRPLGDVCQSMTVIGDKAYLVINNSSKIEITKASTFESVGTINGFISPRYLLNVNSQKAYVSDLYANAISVVNLNQNQLIKQIPLRGWTEEMLLHNGKVYVTNLRTNYLYCINPVTDVLEDSLFLGFPSGSLVVDKNGRIWVLCSEVLSTTAPSRLIRLNASASMVEQVFDLATGAGKVLRINGKGDRLYWIKNHVYRMNIADATLPTQPFITKGNGEFFYSLGIEPIKEDVFVGNAPDFIKNGNAKHYDVNGNFIQSFPTGIAPGNFFFY